MSSAVKGIILKTTQPDRAHFPAMNQAHFCWQKYNEFVLCLKKTDGDEDECKKARQLALSICPSEWVESWDNQRTAGNFLGVQEKEPEPAAHGHGGHH